MAKKMHRKIDDHYPIWLLHLMCLFACAVIVVIGVLWIRSEKQRTWRFFQQQGYKVFESARLNDDTATVTFPRGDVLTFETQRSRLARQDDGDTLVSTAGQFHELVLPDLNTRLGPIEVPRRERCLTCHVLADWTGNVPKFDRDSAQVRGPLWARPTHLSEPIWEVFPKGKTIEVVLPVLSDRNDEAQPRPVARIERNQTDNFTVATFGFSWTKPGLVTKDEPRIAAVLRGSPSDLAGLRPGDLIARVANSSVKTKQEAEAILIGLVKQSLDGTRKDVPGLLSTFYPAPFGDAAQVPGIQMTILRGLQQPWTGHPHPELYVAEESYHPANRFGCTICHDGQGLALDYTAAEHPPSRAGIYDPPRRQPSALPTNKDSIEPMILTDLVESRCLRCHEKVFDLVESEGPLEPVAERLVNGRRLVEQHGCYSCHELQPKQVTGDSGLSLAPPVQEIAEELLASSLVSPKVRESAQHVLNDPYDMARLNQFCQDVAQWQNELEGATNALPSREETLLISRKARQFADALRSALTTPVGLPKIGPSLRHVASKLTPQTIANIIKNPQEARPSSRMPQIFGLVGHLSEKTARSVAGFEEIEIAGIVAYLSSRSRPLPQSPILELSLDASPGKLNDKDPIEVGRILFETQGCLACHRHREFPQATSDFGPDLSDLGRRLAPETGQAWLRLWLSSPQTVSPATRMPQPQFRTDAWIYRLFGKIDVSGSDTRPLATPQIIEALAAFLLSNGPLAEAAGEFQPTFDQHSLDDAVLEYISSDLPMEKARQIVENGLTVEELSQYSLQVSEELSELLGKPTREKKLRYVGRKAIGRYGCYGCHSISGFEAWPPIGPSLSQFGSKASALLDFGAVTEGFLATREGCEIQQRTETPLEKRLASLDLPRRETWLWLKLISPRAFDFKAVEAKPILQHSRMGRFPLSGEQRQAIMTYILGLEGHSIPSKYNPYTPSSQALASGREMIERRGCDRCHALRPERWAFRFLEDTLPPTVSDQSETLSQKGDSNDRDAVGSHPRISFGFGLAVGYAERDGTGKIIEDLDELDNPLYFFMPWRPIKLGNRIWPVGEASLPIASTQLLNRRDQDGGSFALLLYPAVIAIAQELQLTMGQREMWGCLPPNLYHSGESLQSAWLAQYLWAPYPIRPAVPLAMPRYQLTNEEIQMLIEYFSARAEKTEELVEAWKTQESQLTLREQEWPGRLDAAWNLIHDSKTYCAKCHIFTGDPDHLALPTEAPPLEEVYQRLRRNYLRAWVTNPKKILPYTAMPVNFPADGRALDRSVFDADSQVQLQAVVDLLEHYDWYARQRLTKESAPRQSR